MKAAFEAALYSLLLCAPLVAGELKVRLHAGQAECLDGAEVSVAPEGGKRVAVRVVADQPVHTLPLPKSPTVVEAVRNGCWGDRRLWSPADGDEIVLRMFGASTVSGELTGPAAVSVRQVRGQLYLRDDRDGRNTSFDNATCTISRAGWQCTVPAGVPFDLRLEVAGFASLHYWDVTAPAAEANDLGAQPLVAGASIGGWIVDPRGTPIVNARVTVFPLESQNTGREHVASSLRTVRSNRRGFFQVSGLAPGPHRLVSEAPKVSPAVVAEITPRAGETVTLPVPVRHSEPGELALTIDPAVDRGGRPWTVQLSEAAPLYPGRQPSTVDKPAGTDGRWSARGLRATVHQLRVYDHNGSLVERTGVELFEGGLSQLHLRIHQIALRGAVVAGDDPLQGEIELWSEAGRRVLLSSDSDGRFEGALPAAGTWKPTVLYPRGPTPARITADPFEVPDDLPADAVHDVRIELPGGRVHGVVMAADGTKSAAVVHALRGVRMAAQQRTGDSGHFDFVGLAPGTYQLDAQSLHGSTAQPVTVTIGDEESRELTLVTEPYVRLSGYVVTPDGSPASGAIIKYSVDGIQWDRIVSDVRGYFERDLPGGVKTAQLIVLTFAYPAKLLTSPVGGDPVRIPLRGDGGVVRFRGPAVISGRGVTAPVHVFRFESTGPFSGQLRIESGTYRLCPTSVPDDRCRQLDVQPSSSHDFAFTPSSGVAGGTT